MDSSEPTSPFLSSRNSVRHLRLASFPRKLAFTRNPSVAAASLLSTNMKYRNKAEGFCFFRINSQSNPPSSLDQRLAWRDGVQSHDASPSLDLHDSTGLCFARLWTDFWAVTRIMIHASVGKRCDRQAMCRQRCIGDRQVAAPIRQERLKRLHQRTLVVFALRYDWGMVSRWHESGARVLR